MIPGLNTNIEYDTFIWHIQTEDQGPGETCFVTHVFRDGAVVVTTRSDYGLETALASKLRLQRKVHREIIEALRAGHLTS